MRTILKNNQMFQRLGLGQFRAMMNAKPTGAAKPIDAANENSGSLYEPGNDDMEQEAIDKVHALFHYAYLFLFNMQNYLSCFIFMCAGANVGFGA